jgi:hypothetical protein
VYCRVGGQSHGTHVEYRLNAMDMSGREESCCAHLGVEFHRGSRGTRQAGHNVLHSRILLGCAVKLHDASAPDANANL